jgi:hypothetical protein
MISFKDPVVLADLFLQVLTRYLGRKMKKAKYLFGIFPKSISDFSNMGHNDFQMLLLRQLASPQNDENSLPLLDAIQARIPCVCTYWISM